MSPKLVIVNRQRAVAVNLGWVRVLVETALPRCRQASLAGSPLLQLALVEVSLLSDKRIASVHSEFFCDPTPTDVITFPHGEILVGAATAVRNAAHFSQSPNEEIALCIIHGLLHLGGWDDRSPSEATAMADRQERILAACRT